MTSKEFVRKNRAKIDAAIRRRVSNLRSIDDNERELWVLNDEDLYRWALAEGMEE